MLRFICSIAILGAVHAAPGFAQPGAGTSRIPEPGAMLPDVRIFDDQGNEFSTASLRGHYSVLVFGCLT